MNELIHTAIIERIIPTRTNRVSYFFNPISIIFCSWMMISIAPVFTQVDSHPLMKFTLFLFMLLAAYGLLTSIAGFLWNLFGKEKIVVYSNFMRVDKIIFFRFSRSDYASLYIKDMYVNSTDYMFNKISKGRNDYLADFRLGTLHFHYNNKIIHIASGLTDKEGKLLLSEIEAIWTDH